VLDGAAEEGITLRTLGGVASGVARSSLEVTVMGRPSKWFREGARVTGGFDHPFQMPRDNGVGKLGTLSDSLSDAQGSE
jgi:hypothetical protein